jgi:hypothetical protein
MEKYFETLLTILKEAMRGIPNEYFYFHVAGKDEPIKRERVYCYELYHQLQRRLPDNFPFTITAEPDKRGHFIIKEGINPDLIIHGFGSMDRNLAVIEVKTADNLSDLPKDFVNIDYMLKSACYFKGISLIYGDLSDEESREVVEKYREHLKNVTILFHRTPEFILDGSDLT